MRSQNPSAPDQELARQTKLGSMEAFEELVYRYEKRLYAFVSQLCPNASDARELTQDTFVRAFQAIDQYDPQFTFAAWLFTIARRKCIDRFRTTRPQVTEPLPDLTEPSNPASLLVQQEDRQCLWRLARKLLSETSFQALWFRYAEEMEVAEIARVMGKTKTHVKVLLFRARQKLAPVLASVGELQGDIPSRDSGEAIRSHGSFQGGREPSSLAQCPQTLPR